MTTRTQRDFRAVVTVIVKHEQVLTCVLPAEAPAPLISQQEIS